ncbi:hypothetical protein JD508_18715 [Aeromonas jandaei]|uniref:hypothetical protein n=1 Tax=Aeromonas jandaei TaxID=650 RepID=UPI00191E5424|nr:hypothetical protein [Aeromonas jandaei]MBL0612263.1 hypothetical protein [Aeromonas jandaei]
MGLLNSAGLIVIITAFLFGSSTAYTNSELRLLGLDSDLMERSFHQVLYHGFIMNLMFIFFMPVFLFLVSFVYYHVVDLFRSSFCKSNRKRFINGRRYLKPLRKIGIQFKKESYALKRLGLAKEMSWVFMSITLLLIFMIAYHEQAGEQAGKRVVEMVRSGKAPIVHIGEGDKEYFMLYCGAKNCAAYDVKNKMIKYFVQDNFSVQKDIGL